MSTWRTRKSGNWRFQTQKPFLNDSPLLLSWMRYQRSPGLLSWIQVLIDENKNESLGLDRPADNGQFILTGSHQLELRSQITQSLAGRTSVLRLLPLSIEEIQDDQLEKENYILPRLPTGSLFRTNTTQRLLSELLSHLCRARCAANYQSQRQPGF
jgi:hypothetical protein